MKNVWNKSRREILKESRPFSVGDILYISNIENRSYKFNMDLFNEKWISAFDNYVIYKEPFCQLINSFVNMLRNRKPFSEFSEMAFPRIISKETANKFELIKLWPNYLFSVSGFKGNGYDNFISSDGEEYYLDPVQCAVFYEYLSNLKKNNINKPIKVREVLGGWSYRNEMKKEIDNILKDAMFLRYEFVFAGRRKDIIDLRMSLVNEICKVLKILNIKFRVVIGDGCYNTIPEKLAAKLRSARKAKYIPIIDVQAYLPFHNKWIEIIGSSILGKDKTSRFIENNINIESGCVGIGLSRLAYSFINVSGLSKNNWPKILKRYKQ